MALAPRDRSRVRGERTRLPHPHKSQPAPPVPAPNFAVYEPRSHEYTTVRPTGDSWTVVCDDTTGACGSTSLGAGTHETRFATVLQSTGKVLTIPRAP